MNEVIENIIKVIIKYSKSPKLYFVIASLGAIIFLLYPFIYANFFFYNRMHNRVEILLILSELDYNKLRNSEILLNEYYAILHEIELQRTRLISVGHLNLPGEIILDNEPFDRLWKFLSGGSLAWTVCFMVLFMNTFTKKHEKPIAFFILMAVGLILGSVGMNIPTFYNRWFNFLGFPVIQILIIVIIALLTGKRKKAPQTTREIVPENISTNTPYEEMN